MPAGPWASTVARLARPFQILLVTEVPSISVHLVEPVSGCRRRRMCIFHAPKSKSKSCWPSCPVEATGAAVPGGGVLTLPGWGWPHTASPVRIWSEIQLTSQVLPPSGEKDCSK